MNRILRYGIVILFVVAIFGIVAIGTGVMSALTARENATQTAVYPTKVMEQATTTSEAKTALPVTLTMKSVEDQATKAQRTSVRESYEATTRSRAIARATREAREAPQRTRQARARRTQSAKLDCFADIADKLRGRFDVYIIISPPAVKADLYLRGRRIPVLGQVRRKYSNTGEAYLRQYYSSLDLKPGNYELRAEYQGKTLARNFRLEDEHEYQVRVEC